MNKRNLMQKALRKVLSKLHPGKDQTGSKEQTQREVRPDPQPDREKTTQETLILYSERVGNDFCARSFSDLASNSEKDIIRWFVHGGLLIPGISGTEDHDWDDQGSFGSSTTGDTDEILRFVDGLHGEWRIDAMYQGIKIGIHKEYPNIMHGIEFRYPWKDDAQLVSFFSQFREVFCNPSIKTRQEDRRDKKPAPIAASEPAPAPATAKHTPAANSESTPAPAAVKGAPAVKSAPEREEKPLSDVLWHDYPATAQSAEDPRRSQPGIEMQAPDFPAGNRFYLFNLYDKAEGNTQTWLVEHEDANLYLDLTQGKLFQETTYKAISERGAERKWKPDEQAEVSFDSLADLIAGSRDGNAAFYAGMNHSNWRDYVSRRFREKHRLTPTRIAAADLLPSPTYIDAFYFCTLPRVSVHYYRRIENDWKLLWFEPDDKTGLERDNYAVRFAAEGERVADELKRSAPNARWYDRTLTSLELQYFLSQLQLSGLYEMDRKDCMPGIQPVYRDINNSPSFQRYASNAQVWYMLNGSRYYLWDYNKPVRNGMNYATMLSRICGRVIRGCELAE